MAPDAEWGRMTDNPGDQRAGEGGREPTAFRRMAEAAQTRLSTVRQLLARYERIPVVGVIAGSTGETGNQQDRSWAARSRFACSSFPVPLLLLVVGIAGFASGFVSARSVSRTTGVYGSLGAGSSRGF